MDIGLVLSGGGTRAVVFHLGVLKRLAEAGRLEDVKRISTVSGGSLVTGLIFTRAGMKWPTSDQYLNEIYPELETLLTMKGLLTFGVLLRSPMQWLHLFHRTRIVANLLKKRWGINGNIADLPDEPKWEINATTFETGRNWYFSKNHMGDWRYGYHKNPPFSIAEACAASAAVPYALGALHLTMPKEGWSKSTYPGDKQLAKRPRKVRLWDGGAYENLGLERVCKPGAGLKGCDFVVISDASAPLAYDYGGFWKKLITTPFRMVTGKLTGPRLFDVASEQIRALRIRMFWSDMRNNDLNTKGVHIRIGNSVRQIDGEAKRSRDEADYSQFQSGNEVALAACHATTLSKLSTEDFGRVCRHGYEAAAATLEGYHPDILLKDGD